MKLLNRASAGLGVGSFVYLLILYYDNQINTVTRGDIICVIIISIFAGVMTILFDIEKLNYLVALVLHFILISMFISIIFFIGKLSGWTTDNFKAIYFFNIFVVYLLSWSVTIIRNRISTRELNKILKITKNNK